jgi:hypothetical protein
LVTAAGRTHCGEQTRGSKTDAEGELDEDGDSDGEEDESEE